MNQQRGFSLIELMVVLAIAAVLLLVALPSGTTMLRNNRMTAQANILLSALTTARSEATKRDRSVAVCASTDQSSCSGSEDFSSGWIMYVDVSNDGNLNTGPDTVLLLGNALPSNLTMKERGSNSFVSFDRLGRTGTARDFVLCLHQDKVGREIKVARTGRAEVVRLNSSLTTGGCQ